MNESLDHLPPEHRADLARLVEMIRSEVDDVQIIILFGSFARGDWKTDDDLPPPAERRSGHPSDYDILVITDSAATGDDAVRWNELSVKTFDMGLRTHARIIAYDFDTFNTRLKECRYFYLDIYNEGKVLFSTGLRTLATPHPLPPEEQKRFAEEYFKEGMSNATDFFTDFGNALNRGSYKIAAFHLNQATEAAYKTIIVVFTNYSPKGHWLDILGGRAEMHAPSVRDVFPLNTEAEKDRFKRLNDAYIGARYDPKYTISKEDLERLAKSVRELLDRTKAACEAALEQMG